MQEEKDNNIKKINEREDSMMATMVEERYEREQCIPVEFWEHFDMLNANLKMEVEIRVHYYTEENIRRQN